MARIELRDTDIVLQDGLSGTAAINEPSTPPTITDTTFAVDTVVLNSTITDKIPIGARFTIAGETDADAVHTVTGRTQGTAAGTNAKQNVSLDASSPGAPTGGTFTLTWGGKTTAAIAYNAATSAVKSALVAMDDGYTTDDWAVTGVAAAWVVEFDGALGDAPRALITGNGTNLTGGGGLIQTITVTNNVVGAVPVATTTTIDIVFSPALGAGTYADGGVVTFLPQELEIKVGDGNLTYSEKMEYEYLLDRGDLDSVREGKQIPMDVNIEFVYEHITQGTGEPVNPMDALKGRSGAAEWVSASSDLCEPYCVHVLVRHTPPCGTAQREQTAFPMFRADSKDIDLSKATISIKGKCKAVEPQVDRIASGAEWPAVAA